MSVKRLLRRTLKAFQHWLANDAATTKAAQRPFDNTYEWLSQSFLHVLNDPLSSRRPAYIWGVLQGVALAKVLRYPRVSVIEFGVAGGAGLLSLERIAELVEEMVNIKIEVHGFDSGKGLPVFKDYRDMPYLSAEGFFPMEKEKLLERLNRAQLHMGLVELTVPEFLQGPVAPVAFISFDLDMYTSTRQALSLLNGDPDRLLPRIPCFFDDTMGYCANDYAGERLAIAEFNAEHSMRKLCPHYGLKFFVPGEHRDAMWPNQMYFAHLLEHPSYNTSAIVNRGSTIDIDGAIEFSRS